MVKAFTTQLPLIFDQLRDNIGTVVVVVSPLVTLTCMKDQVESFKSKGLEATFLVLDAEIVCRCNCQTSLFGADTF